MKFEPSPCAMQMRSQNEMLLDWASRAEEAIQTSGVYSSDATADEVCADLMAQHNANVREATGVDPHWTE